jgi:hypothetical protein
MGVSPPCGRGPAITSRRVVGCRPPTPPVTTLILGPAKPPEIRPFGAEFLRFFGPCGAKSWGGGGAPPTTLILLRNQRPLAPGPSPGPPASLSPPKSAKKCKIFVFFSSCLLLLLERGEARWGASIACGDVSHGRPGGRPCPEAEVLTDSSGVDSPITGKGQLALRGTSGPYRSLQSSGRVWLSQTASSFPQPHGPARTSVLALREDLFRRARTTHWP